MEHCSGFLKAVRMLLSETNTLFESLLNKLTDYPELEEMLRGLLFTGKEIVYVVGVRSVESALMFGFVKVSDSRVMIANRIFETLLYNYFLSVPPMQQEEIYDAALTFNFNKKKEIGVKEVPHRDKILIEAVV